MKNETTKAPPLSPARKELAAVITACAEAAKAFDVLVSARPQINEYRSEAYADLDAATAMLEAARGGGGVAVLDRIVGADTTGKALPTMAEANAAMEEANQRVANAKLAAEEWKRRKTAAEDLLSMKRSTLRDAVAKAVRLDDGYLALVDMEKQLRAKHDDAQAVLYAVQREMSRSPAEWSLPAAGEHSAHARAWQEAIGKLRADATADLPL